MRDIIKNHDYFDELIKTRYNLVNKALDKIHAGLIKPDRLKPYLRFLSQHYNNILNAKYSRGDNMFADEAKQLWFNEISILKDTWEENTGILTWKKRKEIIHLNQYGRSAYISMLNRLSLGILLNIEKEHFQILIDYIDMDNVKDFLFEFLISSYITERNPILKESYTETFDINETFGSLKKIINESDKIKAQEQLKLFLVKEWYQSFKGTPLYEQHKNVHNIYSGYWCFVAAAIVKIKGLDDSSFRDNQYYPKDLV